MPHWEYNSESDEKVIKSTSTQYEISGSFLELSGGDQVILTVSVELVEVAVKKITP